jgi:Cu+-exporting ATPase
MTKLSRPADVILHVDGMMCQKNCANTVKKALEGLEMVEACEVSHAKKEAEIWIDENVDTVDPAQLIDTVECVGYDASIKFVNGNLVHANEEAPSSNEINKTEEISNPDFIIKIEDMKSKDSRKLESILSAIDGVINITIDETNQLALIWGYAEEESLLKALQQSGYDAYNNLKPKPAKSTTSNSNLQIESSQKRIVESSSTPKTGKREFLYEIRGMSCGSCALKIEKALAGMPGVVECAVSVMTHQGKAVLDENIHEASGPRDLLEKIKSLGYEGDLIDTSTNLKRSNSMIESSGHELQSWKRSLIISLIFGIPVLFFHMFAHATDSMMMFFMQPEMCGNGIDMGQLIMFGLNLPLVVVVGWKYYKSAVIGAYHGMLGMDFLVMTGTLVTFSYSFLQLVEACRTGIPTENVFFETAGMLLLFVTVGKYIEAYAKGKSASSVVELMKLQPQEVRIVQIYV